MLHVNVPKNTLAVFASEHNGVKLTREQDGYRISIYNSEKELRSVTFAINRLVAARESFKATVSAFMNSIGEAEPAQRHEEVKRI